MKPLSESKGIQVENNPAKDLTVVCSNCHRMIHKNRDITLTIEELKNKIDFLASFVEAKHFDLNSKLTDEMFNDAWAICNDHLIEINSRR